MAEFQRRWERIKKERKTWKKFKCGRNESYIKRGRQSKTIKRCSNSTVFHYVKLHDPFSAVILYFLSSLPKFCLPSTNIDFAEKWRRPDIERRIRLENFHFIAKDGGLLRLFRGKFNFFFFLTISFSNREFVDDRFFFYENSRFRKFCFPSTSRFHHERIRLEQERKLRRLFCAKFNFLLSNGWVKGISKARSRETEKYRTEEFVSERRGPVLTIVFEREKFLGTNMREI